MTFLFLSLENTHHTAKWHCLFSLAINLIIYFHKMRVSCWIFLNIKNNLCTFLYHQNRCLIIRVFNSISNIFDDFALVWVVQSSLLTSYVFKMIEGYGPHMCGSSWIEKLLPTIILHESKFSGGLRWRIFSSSRNNVTFYFLSLISVNTMMLCRPRRVRKYYNWKRKFKVQVLKVVWRKADQCLIKWWTANCLDSEILFLHQNQHAFNIRRISKTCHPSCMG